MTTRFLGEEGFQWFIGVVEDREDPEKRGRVKVRVHGLHDENKARLPTSGLPWATVILPAISASLKQVGISATGLQVGSTVLGFFLDGKEANVPVIFGSIPGIGDIPQLAADKPLINKQPLGPEPVSAFAAKHPYNKVVVTESGHVFEVDDTPNAQRLHNYHRSGTYEEVDVSGRRVNKVVGDDYEIVAKNKTIYIQGDWNIEVRGNFTLNVQGNIVINGKSINLNRGTKGAARFGDAVPDSEIDGTQGIGAGSSTVFIGN
jgi:hypothetical protein